MESLKSSNHRQFHWFWILIFAQNFKTNFKNEINEATSSKCWSSTSVTPLPFNKRRHQHFPPRTFNVNRALFIPHIRCPRNRNTYVYFITPSGDDCAWKWQVTLGTCAWPSTSCEIVGEMASLKMYLRFYILLVVSQPLYTYLYRLLQYDFVSSIERAGWRFFVGTAFCCYSLCTWWKHMVRTIVGLRFNTSV